MKMDEIGMKSAQFGVEARAKSPEVPSHASPAHRSLGSESNLLLALVLALCEWPFVSPFGRPQALPSAP